MGIFAAARAKKKALWLAAHASTRRWSSAGDGGGAASAAARQARSRMDTGHRALALELSQVHRLSDAGAPQDARSRPRRSARMLLAVCSSPRSSTAPPWTSRLSPAEPPS